MGSDAAGMEQLSCISGASAKVSGGAEPACASTRTGYGSTQPSSNCLSSPAQLAVIVNLRCTVAILRW